MRGRKYHVIMGTIRYTAPVIILYEIGDAKHSSWTRFTLKLVSFTIEFGIKTKNSILYVQVKRKRARVDFSILKCIYNVIE
jgi:hypothetical protein